MWSRSSAGSALDRFVIGQRRASQETSRQMAVRTVESHGTIANEEGGVRC